MSFLHWHSSSCTTPPRGQNWFYKAATGIFLQTILVIFQALLSKYLIKSIYVDCNKFCCFSELILPTLNFVLTYRTSNLMHYAWLMHAWMRPGWRNFDLGLDHVYKWLGKLNWRQKVHRGKDIIYFTSYYLYLLFSIT